MSLIKRLNINDVAPTERIVGLSLIVAVLLPHVGVLYLVNPVLLLFLAYKFPKVQQTSPVQVAMVVLIVASLVWNVSYGIPISSKSLVRGFYIIELLVLFPYVGNVHFRNVYLYVIVIVILLSQLAYVFDIGFIIRLIDAYYPYTGDVVSETTDYLLGHSAAAQSLGDLQSIRFGGLFHNSNQCMKYISMCTVIFAVENYKDKLRGQLPFWGLVVACAILAGSRTGFFIIFFTFAFSYIMGKKKEVKIKSFILPTVIIGGIFYLLSNIVSDEFRMFDLLSGPKEDGSISIKYANFTYYLNLITEFRQMIVGNFDVELIRQVYHTPFSQFDSEWGNAIYFYGYLFFILYFIFLINVIRKLKGINILALLLLLWVISSTVLFSYRTSFAFFFILSRCYSNSKYIVYDSNCQ